MSRGPPDPDAAAAIRRLTTRLALPPGTHRLDARHAAAEAVAACALHLIMQWPAWDTLNTAALNSVGTPEHEAQLAALVAYELLDAAVHAWAPHVHPAVPAAPPPPGDPG